MNRQQQKTLAGIIGTALVALAVLVLVRGGKPQSYPIREAIEIPHLSLAISGYVQDHGQPKGDVIPLLVEGEYLDSKWVKDGQVLDPWGTPYAIFFATVDGTDWSYPEQSVSIAEQQVSPDPSARIGSYPPTHQIISAGPDKLFGTDDDLNNWQ